MASVFHLSVLTPEKSVLDQDVTYLQAPGADGYLGVLAHHAPLISVLDPGKLVVRDADGGETTYALAGGFLEISRNHAVILADAIEKPSEIDVARAQAAQQRARERLQSAVSDASIDVARAEAALKRALCRLRLARS